MKINSNSKPFFILFNRYTLTITAIITVCIALFVTIRTFSPLVLISILLGAIGMWSYIQRKELKIAASSNAKAFLLGVKEMANLTTAKGYVMTIFEGFDNKLFGIKLDYDLKGTKREYMFVIPAEITAGIDLNNITIKDIQIDHSQKSIFVYLPSASFTQKPAIIFDKINIISKEGIFRNSMEMKEAIDIIKDSIYKKIMEQAHSCGILKMAEKNAELLISNLVQKFGYRNYSVIVKYKEMHSLSSPLIEHSV